MRRKKKRVPFSVRQGRNGLRKYSSSPTYELQMMIVVIALQNPPLRIPWFEPMGNGCMLRTQRNACRGGSAQAKEIAKRSCENAPMAHQNNRFPFVCLKNAIERRLYSSRK